jgi:hypothetical protein
LDRNFFRSEALVVDELDGSPLPGLEMNQHFLDQDVRFGRRVFHCVFGRRQQLRQEFIKRVGVEKSAGNEPSPAIQNPLVTEHEEPGFELSLIRIVLLDRSEDIEKNLLDCIFGFGSIAQDAPGDSKEERTVPFEQLGQSIGHSTLQMGYQCFICKPLER